MTAENLYDKYGGFGQVNKIVMAFYDKLLDSDEIGPYFDDIDMSRLIDHQTKFIASLLGGPASFTDEHLGKAHSALNVTHAHFDELKEILYATLTEHGVTLDDSAQLVDAVEARRAVIVKE